jgi:hypothetical protein
MKLAILKTVIVKERVVALKTVMLGKKTGMAKKVRPTDENG